MAYLLLFNVYWFIEQDPVDRLVAWRLCEAALICDIVSSGGQEFGYGEWTQFRPTPCIANLVHG